MAAPNCTIDLDELLKNGNVDHSIDRRQSTTSISSAPRQTSTPDGDRFRAFRRERSRVSFGKIRKALSSLNGRRTSSGSSGIGSSVDSEEENEQHEPTTHLKRFLPNTRSWASNLCENRPKIIIQPTPSILVHRCSAPRRHNPNIQHGRIEADAVSSNQYLRVTCAWNGPAPGHVVRCGNSPGIRRAVSHTSGDSPYRYTSIRRTFSESDGDNIIPLSSLGSMQQYKIDHQVLIHAPPKFSSSNINHQLPAAVVNILPNPVQNDSPNCSFSDYL